MKRQVSLAEISDGRLYRAKDMVKADCHGCRDCSKCCEGMGNSIILDPYDVYRLTAGLGRPLEDLLGSQVELNVVDGLVLPNLKMTGEKERCAFLNQEGRCSIHPFRPGICRMFPLGRYYENGSFRYFLQVGECEKNHTKIKVSKWIDTPNLRQYEEFVTTWHYLLNRVEELAAENEADAFRKKLSILVLKTFYLAPYEKTGEEEGGEACLAGGFYGQFAERLARFEEREKEIRKEF